MLAPERNLVQPLALEFTRAFQKYKLFINIYNFCTITRKISLKLSEAD